MSSRIEIQKRCKWCGNLFTAHKTTTEYCSHRCANLAYKDKIRKQRIESYNQEIGKSIRLPSRPDKEYLTPTEVSILLGVGRTSIYRYIKTGKIKVIRFNRKTLIKRTNHYITRFLCAQNKCKTLNIISYESHLYKSDRSPKSDSQ